MWHIWPKYIHMFCLQIESPPTATKKLIFNYMINDNVLLAIDLNQPIIHREKKVKWKFVSHLPKFAAMKPIILFLFFPLLVKTLSLGTEPAENTAQITVMGLVYCDICSNNSFSRHSYFLPGAEVQIDCNFRAFVPKTREQISFSVNRTTDKRGLYVFDIPSVDGFECAEASVASTCKASVVGTSSTSCNVPGYSSTTDVIAFKSRHPNICIYSPSALNFRPLKTEASLCGK